MNKFVTDLCKCGIAVEGVLRKVSRYMLIISCLNPLSGKESFRQTVPIVTPCNTMN